MSAPTFADLGASRAVVSALAKRGFTAPFAIQAEVIGDVLAGRDVLARSPTGSGKTLAFGIPLIDRIAAQSRRPAGLVLAPTRELATQIVDELRPLAHARALSITAVYGGVGLVKQGREAANAHIVVATPGRLEDQLSRGAFRLDDVQMLVLDEADRMLDMGFKPAVDRIVALCRRPDRQTLCFSATLDGEAGRVARAVTRDAVEREHGPRERRSNASIEHRFVTIEHEHRVDALVKELNAGGRDLAIVFVRTKRGADRLAKRLADHGIVAAAMHGDKSQRQRERALAQFENYEVDVLVATDVAARGIDVSGISHVVNFDPPEDSDAYVHRTGRTARAGAKGVAVTLVAPDQHKEMAILANALGIEHGLPTRGHQPTAPTPRPGGGRPGGRSGANGQGRNGQARDGQGRNAGQGRGSSGAPRGNGGAGRGEGGDRAPRSRANQTGRNSGRRGPRSAA